MTTEERKHLKKELRVMQTQIERLEGMMQEIRAILARQHEEADEEIRHCRAGLGLPVDIPIRRARA